MDFLCKLLMWSFIAAYWLNEASRKERHRVKALPATIAPTPERNKPPGFGRRSATAAEVQILPNKTRASWGLR
jgi:hypothetical protein